MTDTEVKTESNGQSAPVTNSGDGNQTKKDFTPEEINAKIVRQIEHYFGDYNLPRDKFLKETIKTDDGWVPMETMLNFQRLAALSTDSKVIMDALKKGGSGLMEVDEDNQKIRRCPTVPLPEWNDARREELMESTVYVKGFNKDSTFEDLLTFFMRFPNVLNVNYRKYKDFLDPDCKEGFKGSVFVVFKDKESAQKFMSIESLKLENSEVELIRKWKKDYDEEKNQEFMDKRRKIEEAKSNRKKAAQFGRNAKKFCPTSNDEATNDKVGHKRKSSGSKQDKGAKRRKNMEAVAGEKSCYNCGENGHYKKNCTKEIKNEGKNNKGCYNCGEDGHKKRDCNNATKATQDPRVCNDCNKVGHIARECKNFQDTETTTDQNIKQEAMNSAIVDSVDNIKQENVLESAKAVLEAAKADIETAQLKMEEENKSVKEE